MDDETRLKYAETLMQYARLVGDFGVAGKPKRYAEILDKLDEVLAVSPHPKA